MTLRGGGRPRRLVGRPDGETPDDAQRRAVPGDGERGTVAYEPDGNGYGDQDYEPSEEYESRYDDPEYFRGAERPVLGRGRREAKRRYSSRSGGGQLIQFVLFAAVLATVVVGAMLLVARPIAVRLIVSWGSENRTALSLPFVADIVRGELGQYLTVPAGSDAGDVTFVVTPGETPSEIADALQQAGLLKDGNAVQAFIFQSIVSNASTSFLAGTHTLRKTMTPMQIIAALQQAPPVRPIIKVTFREGLRVEQMVALLEKLEATPTDPTHPLHIDVEQFYNLVEKPPASLTSKYPFLQPRAPLEGFLFPATYDLYSDTTADQLISKLLDAFAQNAPPDLLKLPADQVYAKVTLASLVETEAKVDSERALIAGVYQNRLTGNFDPRLLNADPSVNYAKDTMWLQSHPMPEWVQYSFWERVSGPMKDFQVPESLVGYQTYQHVGLPPTPICSPSGNSLTAAMNPDTKDGYYYFVAKGDGTHAFDKTLAEFNADLQKYGYTP